MADDAGILQQPFDIGLAHFRDLRDLEVPEGLAEVLALA